MRGRAYFRQALAWCQPRLTLTCRLRSGSERRLAYRLGFQAANEGNAMPDSPFVFVSYARSDREAVSRIVGELRGLGIRTWVDAEQLRAGESWEQVINEALGAAQVLLVFISPAMVRSKWIAAEFEQALTRGVRILPVLLSPTPSDSLPQRLQHIQWLDATQFPAGIAAKSTAREIATIVHQWRGAPVVPGSAAKGQVRELAKALAAQTRGPQAPPDDGAPKSVFVVHGHDDGLLTEVIEFIANINITPIVLKNVEGATKSLLDRFFEVGGSARFAIVLLSADDFGASRSQYEEPDVGGKALKYRARQNVILELGYFYGLLGWDNVFVLEKEPSKKFPDFERPSDLSGVVFDRYDGSGKWKAVIARRLESHGFSIEGAKGRPS